MNKTIEYNQIFTDSIMDFSLRKERGPCRVSNARISVYEPDDRYAPTLFEMEWGNNYVEYSKTLWEHSDMRGAKAIRHAIKWLDDFVLGAEIDFGDEV